MRNLNNLRSEISQAIFEVLKESDRPVTNEFIRQKVQAKLSLTDDELDQLTGEGNSVYRMIASLDLSVGANAKVYEHVARGQWRITDVGKKYNKVSEIEGWNYPTNINENANIVRIFGEIPGIEEGENFASRRELSDARVHRPLQAGISGSQAEGADSVVLSGGYDDQDDGDIIIYTGHGGRDENSGEYIADQTLSRQNLALAISKDKGLPVRVIRGASHASNFSPANGYRYDGLYLVESYWTEIKNGYNVIRFKLVKIPGVSIPPVNQERVLTGENLGQPTSREKSETYRIIRDTKKAIEIKQLYDYHCQVCDVRLEGPNGPYAEAAHIKALGIPHNGPDDQDNLLCLCPNHHKLFDMYAFTIDEDLNLIGIDGKLIIKSNHTINTDYIRYRLQHFTPLMND